MRTLGRPARDSQVTDSPFAFFFISRRACILRVAAVHRDHIFRFHEINRASYGTLKHRRNTPRAALTTRQLSKRIRKEHPEETERKGTVSPLPLRGGSTRLKITWVQQRQHHTAQESARERGC